MKEDRNSRVLTYSLLLLLLLITRVATAQSIANSNKCFTKPDTLDGSEVFSAVTKPPEYSGGMTQFYKDVLKHLKNPKGRTKFSDKLTFTFVIDKEGRVRNFCFIDPNDGRYDDQIEWLVENINNWTAGELHNRKVSVRMLLPMMVEWNDR